MNAIRKQGLGMIAGTPALDLAEYMSSVADTRSWMRMAMDVEPGECRTRRLGFARDAARFARIWLDLFFKHSAK